MNRFKWIEFIDQKQAHLPVVHFEPFEISVSLSLFEKAKLAVIESRSRLPEPA